MSHVHRPGGPECRFPTKKACEASYRAWQESEFERIAQIAADHWGIATRDRIRDKTIFGKRVRAIVGARTALVRAVDAQGSDQA